MRAQRIAAMMAAAVPLVVPLAAAADTPMTGAEFEAYVGTSTVTYHYSTGDIGVADYGPDRTLRWFFAGEDCVNAQWYELDERLCFDFDDPSMSGCWHFYRQANGILGISTEPGEAIEIIDVERSDTPIICPGPNVGV